MPSYTAFLRGFGIKKGIKIAGYTLTKVHIDHYEVERYKEYRYPITLTFTADGPQSQGPILLLSQLQMMVNGERVIRSQYGNPYSCYFGSLKTTEVSQDNQTVIIESEGIATRIYE